MAATYTLYIFSKISNDRLLANKALRESEQQYRRLFESFNDGILLLDGETGKLIDANPFIFNMLSYSLDESIGKKLW